MGGAHHPGRGKRKSFYAKTRQGAARKLAAALRDQEAGLPVLGDKQTVEQYLTMWLESVKPTIRLKTWQGYEQLVRNHVLPTLGKVSLVKLNGQHLQLLYAKKLEAGLSSTTVHHLHMLLHKALSRAVRLGLT